MVERRLSHYRNLDITGEEPAARHHCDKCLSWVKVRPQIASDRRPFVPQQQTLIRATAWSASCQFRKWPGSPCGGLLCRDVLLRDDCDDPARWYTRRNLLHRADQSRDQRALDRQRSSFVPKLGVPATTRQGLITCLEGFHASTTSNPLRPTARYLLRSAAPH